MMHPVTRTKAKYSEPCNRCGLCCTKSLCPAAEVAFYGESAPCKALIFNEPNQAVCGLALLESDLGLDPLVRRMLGIGCGCTMPNAETTEEEITDFGNFVYKMVYETKMK